MLFRGRKFSTVGLGGSDPDAGIWRGRFADNFFSTRVCDPSTLILYICETMPKPKVFGGPTLPKELLNKIG